MLRVLEYVAYPALAGSAFCLLSLGVVTWLPALAAMAHVLERWRADGDSRCFTGVFVAFPRYWRALWGHALASTAALAVLVAGIAFLVQRPEPVAIPLLAVQVGVFAAFVTYHLAVAVVAGAAGPQHARPRRWCAIALVFAFGSVRRGLGLLAAAVLAPAIALPLAVGPFVLGPSLAVLAGLVMVDTNAVRAKGAPWTDPHRSHPASGECSRRR